jgi:hypothetical protein
MKKIRRIESWEELIEELIESDYDLEENVIVPFDGKDYIFDNEQVDYYRKEYGRAVVESLHHPVLEHLLERKFLKLA